MRETNNEKSKLLLPSMRRRFQGVFEHVTCSTMLLLFTVSIKAKQ